MKIKKDEQIDATAWSALVQTSATGTWFQTPEAFEFFQSQPELFKLFAYGVVNDGRLRGVCVGYVTMEKSALKQMLTRRAIIVGGPCLADDCTADEVTELMKTVQKELKGEAIYVESRNFNDYSKWKEAFTIAGFEYVPHLNFHVDTSSVEVVEANLGKSRKRDIRTTIREGVVVKELKNEGVNELEREQMVHEYYQILKNLYKTKVKTPLFPESFFQALAKHPDARFLLTELNGKIIGGTVCVAQEDKCLYEWFACGEDGVYPHVFPSCYATYAGIKYAAEHGMPRFDMMGAGKPDEAYGVRDFKAKFGGKEVDHGRFLCITKPLLYKIGVLGVKILKKLK
jgi:hypothetical protein